MSTNTEKQALKSFRKTASLVLLFIFLTATAGFCGEECCEKPPCPLGASAFETDPNETQEPSGPTLLLEYEDGDLSSNPISNFMYFVPLVSPVEVQAQVSDENTQHAELLGYAKRREGAKFQIEYEFAMLGEGYHQYNFDPEQMIKRGLENYDTSDNKPLKNMLEYIRFEGQGAGRIDVFGRYEAGAAVVEKVDVHFDARGKKSPVTAGLFSVKNVNGKYDYTTRYAPVTARIRTLTFTRSDELPRMALSVASVDQVQNGRDLLAGVKAFIANLFIEPFRINPVGNESMLEFGLALHDRQETFTFPYADKLIVPIVEPGSETAAEQERTPEIKGS